MEHKGWHSRGYLPHCDFADSIQGITFRLGDSVPKSVIDGWRRELADDGFKGNEAERRLFHKISKYEDAGHGECLLRSPDCAAVVQRVLLKHHMEHYRLMEWCVMPNHVHVLIGVINGHPLGKVVQGWKGGSSVEINRLSKRGGSIWMPDYHDRYIRDQEHLLDARIYIRMNPVKAGLCGKPEEWEFSSAGMGWKA